jgi:predicted cupin superfamily sugar epimerase
MGPDVLNGEVTQLYVPGGWWKASEIPEEDMLLLDAPNADDQLRERIGCLISEVVVPGWEPSQHAFVDEEKARRLAGVMERC